MWLRGDNYDRFITNDLYRNRDIWSNCLNNSLFIIEDKFKLWIIKKKTCPNVCLTV